MHLHKEEMIKKVLAWKVCSMSLTMTTLYVYLGSLSDAALLTFVLHGMFIFTHWAFEILWQKRSENNWY